jgi:ABC-type sugar transport system permease subunit
MKNTKENIAKRVGGRSSGLLQKLGSRENSQSEHLTSISFLSKRVREWFGDFHIALYTLTVISGWAFTGLPMIFYFAGLGDVPKETIDAARIEGAGHFRMITRVALPQLRPVTAVVVMLTLFESFKAFDLVAVLTKGARPLGPPMYWATWCIWRASGTRDSAMERRLA